MSVGLAADRHALEEGDRFTPRFDQAGLIPCVTTDAATGAVLMVAWMNAEALRLTLETREVTYWSRSRSALWRKGETSGQRQQLVEMRTDCDQDTLVLRVTVGGDGGCCHTGRRSCFYRRIDLDAAPSEPRLVKVDLTHPGEMSLSETVAGGGLTRPSR